MANGDEIMERIRLKLAESPPAQVKYSDRRFSVQDGMDYTRVWLEILTTELVELANATPEIPTDVAEVSPRERSDVEVVLGGLRSLIEEHEAKFSKDEVADVYAQIETAESQAKSPTARRRIVALAIQAAATTLQAGYEGIVGNASFMAALVLANRLSR